VACIKKPAIGFAPSVERDHRYAAFFPNRRQEGAFGEVLPIRTRLPAASNRAVAEIKTTAPQD
jgi:hypothetical protein